MTFLVLGKRQKQYLASLKNNSEKQMIFFTSTFFLFYFLSFQYNFPESVRESEIFTTLDYLNKNDSVDGILVQLPLPKHLDEDRLIQYIHPHKVS